MIGAAKATNPMHLKAMSDIYDIMLEHRDNERRAESRRDTKKTVDSAIIGAVTNSAVLGAVLGGSVTGGVLGDLLNGGKLDD